MKKPVSAFFFAAMLALAAVPLFLGDPSPKSIVILADDGETCNLETKNPRPHQPGV